MTTSFSNSKLLIHQQQYSRSISVWTLHFSTHALFFGFVQCNDFTDRAQLLIKKLAKQSYVITRLMSLSKT